MIWHSLPQNIFTIYWHKYCYIVHGLIPNNKIKQNYHWHITEKALFRSLYTSYFVFYFWPWCCTYITNGIVPPSIITGIPIAKTRDFTGDLYRLPLWHEARYCQHLKIARHIIHFQFHYLNVRKHDPLLLQLQISFISNGIIYGAHKKSQHLNAWRFSVLEEELQMHPPRNKHSVYHVGGKHCYKMFAVMRAVFVRVLSTTYI